MTYEAKPWFSSDNPDEREEAYRRVREDEGPYTSPTQSSQNSSESKEPSKEEKPEEPSENKEEKEEEGNLLDKAIDGVTGAVASLGDRDFPEDQTFGSAVKDGAKNFAYTAAAIPLSIVDFGMDAIGRIPGTAWIDDAWDEKTKFSDPTMATIRDLASVIVPSVATSLVATPAAGKAVAAINGGKAFAGLAKFGTAIGSDMAIAQLSDYSERDEGLLRGIDDTLEAIGRPMDLKIPDAAKVMDGDSAQARRNKLMWEAAGLSIVADAVGYALSAGKPILGWFKPSTPEGKAFKEVAIRENPDPNTVFRTMELDEEIAQLNDEIAGSTDQKLIKELTSRRDALAEENAGLYRAYFDTGRSSATVDPLASKVQEGQASRNWQTDERAIRSLEIDPETREFNPYVQANLAPESSRPVQSIPRASVQRNAADIAAKVTGTIPPDSVPAPLTNAMMTKGMDLDRPARELTRENVDAFNAAGPYTAEIDGVRQAYKDIKESSNTLFTDIFNAKDADELVGAFKSFEDIKRVGDKEIRVLNDAAIPQSGKALKYLVRMYLGEDVNAMAARELATAGAELNVITDTMKVLKSQVDDEAMFGLLKDKIEYITERYGVSKYVASRGLNIFKWWKKGMSEADLEDLAKNFDAMASLKKEEAAAYAEDLARLKKENPTMATNLMMAYDATDGDVNTMAKLNEWTRTQLNPLTTLTSSKFGNTAFAEGAWGVIYNNVLSGLSAARATTGAISSLALKPIDYMIGAGIRGIMKGGDFSDLRKGWYAFGANWEVGSKALGEGWKTFKKASNNPQEYMEMLRKDYGFEKMRNNNEVLDRMIVQAQKDGNTGLVNMYKWHKFNQYMSMNKYMRYGTNLMLGIDRATNIMQATMTSKFRAWDEAYQAGQKMDTAKLMKAQEAHYAKVFDPKTDLIRDSWTKQQGADIALNETTEFGSYLSKVTQKYPALKPFMMFPNTGYNQARKAMSYTPFAAIPGSSRSAKTMMAESTEEIQEVLRLHDIPIDDPQGFMIVENLKNEYMGRLFVGSATALGLAQYALSGNIRGNLPKNKEDRNYLLSQPNYMPKSIKIGGVWVSYAGVQMLDPILTMIGDLAYYATDLDSPFVEDKLEKIAWTISQSFGGATPLKGVEPLIALAQGDTSAAQRLINNSVRMLTPLSGAAAVLGNAVDGAAKETYNDTTNYIFSRLGPGKAFIPNKYDWWTGQVIRVTDNPILNILNAINPVPVSQGEEDWRIWINQTGFDGSMMLIKDTSGSHTYTSKERSKLSQFMGEAQMYKKIQKWMKYDKYNDQIDQVRAEMSKFGRTWDELSPKSRNLPIVKMINNLVNETKKGAEERLFREYPSIREKIAGTKRSKQLMQRGRVKDAYDNADKTREKLKQLENFR